VHRFMAPYERGSGAGGLSILVDVLILLCIVVSCVLVILEVVYDEADYPGLHRRLLHAELAFVGIFIVEYLLRWYGAPNRLVYPFSFHALIDLLAILPTILLFAHLMLTGQGFLALRVVRALRLLRLVRLARVLRYRGLIYRLIADLRVWISALNDQYHLGQLIRLLVWLVTTWVIGANVLHVTEYMLATQASPYYFYWESYWNTILVLVSGMDAEQPVTWIGRAEVLALLMAGLIGVGMLTGEIVSVLVRKLQRSGMVPLKPPHLLLEQHIVILGRSRHLHNLILQMHAALGERYFILVVAEDAGALPLGDREAYRRVFALPGDPMSQAVLREANVSEAARVIALSPEDAASDHERDNIALMSALAVTGLAPQTKLIVELRLGENLRHAAPLQNAECVVSRTSGERLIAQAVLEPGSTLVFDELLTYTDDSNEIYSIAVPESLVGRSFQEAQLHFLDRDEDEVLVIGIDRDPPADPESEPNTETRGRFLLHPAGDMALPAADCVLHENDRLVVLAFERNIFLP
jgi:voltage-gated potassium channel